MKAITNGVDKLAELRAQINDLKKAEAKLEAAIKARGIGQYAGTDNYVTVFEQAGAEKIDWKAVAAKFAPSHQLIAAHTTRGNDKIVLKIFGYPANGKAVAA